MIESLLIANRGEIARRIIRTARRLGVRTIAVYSDADAAMPFVREADAAVAHRAGARRAKAIWIRTKILAAARADRRARPSIPATASCRRMPDFAEAVIGGRAGLGRRAASRHPRHGPEGRRQDTDERGRRAGDAGLSGRRPGARRGCKREADAIGYPVLIKAVAGGGGKGMRRVEARRDFDDALASCQREAASSFGDDRVLLEKYITAPAAYRGAGVRRQPRQCRASVRARLFAAAPPPESDRGSARARHGRRHPRGAVRHGGQGGAGGELCRRRHHRIHRRRLAKACAPIASGSWK